MPASSSGTAPSRSPSRTWRRSPRRACCGWPCRRANGCGPATPSWCSPNRRCRPPSTRSAPASSPHRRPSATSRAERASRRLDAAEAELRGAASEVERTSRELVRMRTLAAGRAVSQQALDNAEAAARNATSMRDAAAERLALLRAGSRPDRISQARADLTNARAALAAIEATAGDLVLLASQDAVVLSRLAEPGEVLTPGIARPHARRDEAPVGPRLPPRARRGPRGARPVRRGVPRPA